MQTQETINTIPPVGNAEPAGGGNQLAGLMKMMVL